MGFDRALGVAGEIGWTIALMLNLLGRDSCWEAPR